MSIKLVGRGLLLFCILLNSMKKSTSSAVTIKEVMVVQLHHESITATQNVTMFILSCGCGRCALRRRLGG
jgi:hypothetical protein